MTTIRDWGYNSAHTCDKISVLDRHILPNYLPILREVVQVGGKFSRQPLIMDLTAGPAIYEGETQTAKVLIDMVKSYLEETSPILLMFEKGITFRRSLLKAIEEYKDTLDIYAVWERNTYHNQIFDSFKILEMFKGDKRVLYKYFKDQESLISDAITPTGLLFYDPIPNTAGIAGFSKLPNIVNTQLPCMDILLHVPATSLKQGRVKCLSLKRYIDLYRRKFKLVYEFPNRRTGYQWIYLVFTNSYRVRNAIIRAGFLDIEDEDEGKEIIYRLDNLRDKRG